MHQICFPNVYAPMLVLLQYSREGGPYVVKQAKAPAAIQKYAAWTTEETAGDFECGRHEPAFYHLSILFLFLLPFWITRLRSQDDL